MTSVLKREGDLETYRHDQKKEGHVMTEAQIGVTHGFLCHSAVVVAKAIINIPIRKKWIYARNSVFKYRNEERRQGITFFPLYLTAKT